MRGRHSWQARGLRFCPGRLAADLLANPFQAIRTRLYLACDSVQLTTHELGKAAPAAGAATGCHHLEESGPRGNAPSTGSPAAAASR